MKVKKTYMTIICALTVLLDAISAIRSIVSFCKIPCKTITVRSKFIIPEKFSGKNLFKTANNIWTLGKNNFNRSRDCRLLLDTGSPNHRCYLE
jgi:hypothetical protein